MTHGWEREAGVTVDTKEGVRLGCTLQPLAGTFPWSGVTPRAAGAGHRPSVLVGPETAGLRPEALGAERKPCTRVVMGTPEEGGEHDKFLSQDDQEDGCDVNRGRELKR